MYQENKLLLLFLRLFMSTVRNSFLFHFLLVGHNTFILSTRVKAIALFTVGSRVPKYLICSD